MSKNKDAFDSIMSTDFDQHKLIDQLKSLQRDSSREFKNIEQYKNYKLYFSKGNSEQKSHQLDVDLIRL